MEREEEKRWNEDDGVQVLTTETNIPTNSKQLDFRRNQTMQDYIMHIIIPMHFIYKSSLFSTSPFLHWSVSTH